MAEAGMPKKLKQQHLYLILQELSDSLNYTKRKEGKLHYVFQTSFDGSLPGGRQGIQNR